jgi:predicted nucleic acid-binding protein
VSRYYLDTSALVKRYVDEAGSDWLRTLTALDQNALLFISRMTIVEVISAFARRLRDGSLTREEFAAARDALQGDCLDEYRVMPPTLDIVNLACALLERHPLRAYDAIHLATALDAQQFLLSHSDLSVTFLSADDRLNRAAAAEGLAVDNPNLHP